MHDGWCGREHVAGGHCERAWPEVIAVGERFHAAGDFAVVDAPFRAGGPQRPDGDDCFLEPVELACSLAR